MDADAFITSVHPLLKSQGFKRSSATWRRQYNESIAVLNVQKSSWDGDVYYINLGVYFHAIGSEVAPTENRCHVRVRLAIAEPEAVVANAISWFEARTTFSQARQLAEADSKKGLVFKELQGG